MKQITLILILFSILFCDPASLILSGSYTGKTGNVDYQYFRGAVSVSKIGLIQMGGLSLPDTEFHFSSHKAKSTNNNVPYENDGSMLLKVDLFAHQTFSPFVFIKWEFDSLSALDHRANIGLGGKYRFDPYFSISYAALFEQEKYMGEDPGTLYRHSLRPKYKRSLGSAGMSINWQFFYKPRFDNLEKYLLNNILVLSFKTFHDALTVDINYQYDFDSKYSINKVAKSYAYAVDGNGEYLTVEAYENLYGTINPGYTTDDNDFVKLPDEFYNPEDHTVSIGLSLKF